MNTGRSVWLVDDVEANLNTFEKAHGQIFKVRTFLNPVEVIHALENECPDAMLCDVFFYETPEQVRKIETKIDEEARRLRQVAAEIGATQENALAGIVLMEKIRDKFHGAVPFPVYAYTSKGPYLLQQAAWDRIIESGAKVLLKNKYGRQSEQLVIREGIEFHKKQNSWRARIGRHLYKVFLTYGVLATIIGILIDRLFLGAR